MIWHLVPNIFKVRHHPLIQTETLPARSPHHRYYRSGGISCLLPMATFRCASANRGHMGRLGDLLFCVGNRWALGAAIGLLFAASVSVIGGASALLVGLAARLAGMSEDAEWNLLLLSALLWLPLALGVVGHGLILRFGPQVAERDKAERQAALNREVARYSKTGS